MTKKTKKPAAKAKKAAGSKKAAASQKKSVGPKVKITLPGGNSIRVPLNTPAGEAMKLGKVEAPYPIVAVRFRNKVYSMERPLDKAGLLEPVHLGSRDGMLIYRRSLSFVLIRAVTELFPDLRIYINHSLDQGYYCELYCEQYQKDGPVQVSEVDMRSIERRMQEIIDADEPIQRGEYPLEKAIKIFEEAELHDKVELLKYSASGPVSVYQLGSEINHFYGQLAPSTGYLKTFELQTVEPGFVLRFPTISKPLDTPPFVHQEKMFGVLSEYERWMRILEWRTVPNLNALIDAGRVREYILIAEALHEKRLAAIADRITTHERRPRIILLSGPSSSGKTTSMKRLAIQLRVNGKRPVVVNLDDFFVNREDTPRDEKGEYDFESFHAIDVARLQEAIRGLLRGERVQLPKFNFQKGRSGPGETMQIDEDQLILLEGIHGLNDNLLPTIPDGLKFKIYASPLTHLNIDDHNRIPSSDARLIRRLVRDFNYRGYDAVQTLKRWPSVRRGEEKNIFPYQENADVIFNSALPYEIAALKTFAQAVLKRVKRSDPEMSEAARLMKFLSYFREIDPDFVPRHSLLREFIGGSCFTY
ncbi:nucleoside kinase [bacterium]|nr:nucleoside kinase [bacterium]